MKIIILAVAASLVLAGCQRGSTVRDTEANRWVSLDGAQLQVRQPLPVRAGKARVFVQDGVVRGGFNSYDTHCAFEIDSIEHDGVTIEPDIFQVVRVQRTVVQVVQSEPLRVAGLWRLNAGLNGFGSSSYYEGYHFWTYSERQPEVRRMTCFGVYAPPGELQPPSLDDVRRALGGLVEIRR